MYPKDFFNINNAKFIILYYFLILDFLTYQTIEFLCQSLVLIIYCLLPLYYFYWLFLFFYFIQSFFANHLDYLSILFLFIFLFSSNSANTSLYWHLCSIFFLNMVIVEYLSSFAKCFSKIYYFEFSYNKYSLRFFWRLLRLI